ncbi:MAG: SPASM domain-containing protein, partial [Arenicellales bacterium]
CFLHMNTTGFFLNRRVSDKLCAARLSIRFSIHAGTNETYKKIMGKDFERVIRNVSYLIDKSRQVGNPESDFWFSFIVMKENLDEIEDFLLIADQLGITKVRFMALNPSRKTVLGARREELDFDFNYFEQFNSETKAAFLERLPLIEDRARKLGITIEVGSMESAANIDASWKMVANAGFARVFPEKSVFPLLKRSGDCMAPWTGQARVFQNGDVNLCCSTNYSLGNLFEKSFDQIWNDKKVRTIRRSFARGFFPRVCGYCNGIGPAEYPVDFFREIPGVS